MVIQTLGTKMKQVCILFYFDTKWEYGKKRENIKAFSQNYIFVCVIMGVKLSYLSYKLKI